MADVDILIPYRPDHGPRDDHLAWVRAQWARHFPRYRLIVGTHTQGLWNKAHAVRQALHTATGSVTVIADADVWMPQTRWIQQAVDVVAGQGRWALPHHYVHRLDEEATRAFKADPALDHRALGHDRVPYGGMIGGGLVVVRRQDYLRYGGLDPAFEGHTGEDEALGYLLSTLVGRPWRGRGDLVHLYHPEQPTKRDPHVQRRNARRLERYKQARHRPGLMLSRAREITGQADLSSPPR